MTPPGVFFLAIFQQTANLKQICLCDSAICQQLQNVHNHFRNVKNCVYSTFWGFRYVRMYRFCTHVHSKKAKFSHLSVGCSQSGNRQFFCLVQNSGCGFYRCVQFEYTYFGPIKRCAWRIFAVAIVRISYIGTQQKGQVLPFSHIKEILCKMMGSVIRRPLSGRVRMSCFTTSI